MASFILIFADLFALTLAMGLAFALRFDELSLAFFVRQMTSHYQSLIIALVLFPALFIAFRLYRYAWRFASLEIVGKIITAITLGVLGWYVANLLSAENPMSRSIFAIFWLLSIAMVGSIRIFLRLTSTQQHFWRRFIARLLRRAESDENTRIVILGANPDGVRLQHALAEANNTSYTNIGFLDDDAQHQGSLLQGVRVIGPLRHLYTLLANHALDQVFIALPRGEAIREYVLACRRQQIPVKIIPPLAEVLHGNVIRQLEDISVEDLLRRSPLQTDLSEIGAYLTGKRILVTGAGGSIGSELCRQIVNLAPAQLVLLGHGENSIHDIHQELRRQVPELAERIKMVIASVTDETRIEQTFKKFAPQIVFHTAAHKHVPIMEDNLPEAIQNNIFGTHCVAQACGRHAIERMVLISTDKAVYPSSVMGATKWFCEEVVCGQAEIYPTTTYVSVRFGNVLGSRGSVVPLFKAQIRRGGPVTVTHPDVTRYFMTIPEAVQLVLQTGAIGENGELYLLDMGEPVKIVDLARDMITLCGLIPEVDIPITFTGLRPGEKLHEQLVMDPANLNSAKHPGMSVITRTPAFTPHELAQTLQHFSQQTTHGNHQELTTYFWSLVPKQLSAISGQLSGETDN